MPVVARRFTYEPDNEYTLASLRFGPRSNDVFSTLPIVSPKLSYA